MFVFDRLIVAPGAGKHHNADRGVYLLHPFRLVVDHSRVRL